MRLFSFFSLWLGRKARTGRSTIRKEKRRLRIGVEWLEDRSTPSGLQSLTETAVFPTPVNPTPTNFSLPGSVLQFDPSLGVLQSVVINEQATINSTIGVENTSRSSPSQITATVSGKLEVTGPNVDLAVTPSDNLATFNATTFDGMVDFGGTSGKTYPTASASGSQSQTLTGSAMAPFVSTGTGAATGSVPLTEIGQGTSTASGSGGNLQVTTTNTASAVVTVTYNYYPLSSLSGHVFWDIGQSGPGSTGYNDGIFENYEVGLAGVMVQLSGTDYRGDVVHITTTPDHNGFYSFGNLLPGTYTISKPAGVPGVPGALDGIDTAGTQGGSVSENQIANINLQAGVNGVNNDFAELTPPPGSIAGYVYYDTGTSGQGTTGYNDGIRESYEGPPIHPVYVNLTGTDYQGNTVNRYATIDLYGHYVFANVNPGNYSLIRGPVTDPNALDGKTTTGSQGGVVQGNSITSIALGSGVNGVDNNFGLLVQGPPPPSSLSGYVYYDNGAGSEYNDGIKDADEQGIAGTYVYLIGANSAGSVNTYTVTDANGYYSFNNLLPGAYAIIKGKVPNASAIDGKDTIGSQGGKTIANEFYNIGLAAGVNGINNNFGELLPVVSADFPDVSITKTASPSPVLIGGQLTYTLTVANIGTDNATGLTVTDALPGGVTVYSLAGNGWTFGMNGQTVTAMLSSLAEGATSVITIGVYAPPTPGNITNVATLTVSSPDSNLTDKRSSVTTPVIAPPGVPFPPAQFAIPTGVFSKAQLLGTGSSISSFPPALQEQLVYVESLYRTLTGHPSDPNGLVNYVQELQAGASFAGVVQQFLTSSVVRASEITYYFQVYYHRNPTAAEITTWTNIFNAGISENSVQYYIATSAEYLADHPTDASYINGLTLDALGRAATPQEEAGWQAYIATYGRAAFANVLLHSQEFYTRQLNLTFNAWLQRPPTAAELNIWLPPLQAYTVGLANLYSYILTSREFLNLAIRTTGVA
jgi:uncharacterized repeat protein (TIGR01451 family)